MEFLKTTPPILNSYMATKWDLKGSFENIYYNWKSGTLMCLKHEEN